MRSWQAQWEHKLYAFPGACLERIRPKYFRAYTPDGALIYEANSASDCIFKYQHWWSRCQTSKKGG